jgi:hypothetical protein
VGTKRFFSVSRGQHNSISNFRHVLKVVFFLLDDSPASEFYVPTLQNTLSFPSSNTTFEDGTDRVF